PPTAPARPAAGGASPPVPAARQQTGKSRSVDVLGELEKLRREAMQPSGGGSPPHPAAAGTAARAAAGNGRAELSRSIELSLKREDFKRARRFLVSFQVEDDEHRVVDAVRELRVDIQDTSSLEKLLLHLNIALNAKE
ncbi:MAG: hypothetical protein M3O15_07040, partial [Acidobacteriota bacterium]|nr:hypothetical protein [Acidobacteriota bacterium]